MSIETNADTTTEPCVYGPIISDDARAAHAQVTSLRQQVAAANEKAQTYETLVVTRDNQIRSALDLISDHLIAEAESRQWCGEYDEIINAVNDSLAEINPNFQLKAREREFEVAVEYDVTMTVTRFRTVTATSADAAREYAREWELEESELIDEMNYNGVYMDVVDVRTGDLAEV